jgi:hypothetical protein
VILISRRFRRSRVRRHFYFYLSGLFLNFRDVRNIIVLKIGESGDYLKIHRSLKYEFRKFSTVLDFISNKCIKSRRLKYSMQNS